MQTDPGRAPVPVGPAAPELPFAAPAGVRAVLDRIGRTEDVRFSPDNRRIAIAAFHEDLVVIVDVEIAPGGGDPRIVLTRATALTAAELASPHGVDFLDDDTIVVANRGGRVTVHRLPGGGGRESTTHAPALADSDLGDIGQPGSVRVVRDGVGETEVLVCDNLRSTVTRHRLHPTTGGPTLARGDLVLRRWLDIPDGVAVSDDARWLAISNHNTQCVLVYAYDSGLDEDREPVAVLRGITYPHGLHFTADGGHLLVADAGRPHLHVFAAGASGWYGSRYPVASHRVMDDITFLRGRDNPQEGGPKGLDLDRERRVAVTTSGLQPLAFFDLATLLLTPGEAGDARRLDADLETLDHAAARGAMLAEANARAADAEHRATAAERRAVAAEQHAAVAEQHAAVAEQHAAVAEEHAAVAEEQAAQQAAIVAAYERTKIMRLTRPARRLYGAWRGRRPPHEGARS